MTRAGEGIWKHSEEGASTNIRVWYGPLQSGETGSVGGRGGTSGLYYQAKVLGSIAEDEHTKYKVTFDGHTEEEVEIDMCSPDTEGGFDLPMEEGLQVGEFCEIYDEDEGGYFFGRVHSVRAVPPMYNVSFPFGSRPMEAFPAPRVRRARVWVKEIGWKYVDYECDTAQAFGNDPQTLPLICDLPFMPKKKEKGKRKLKDGETKKRKRKKDKNAPKRAKSGYIVFLNRHREEVRKANPELGMKEVVSILAEMWKTVSAEERSICEEEAQKDKERYRNEMDAYEPPIIFPDDEKNDKDAPKKARSAYIMFSMDYRKRDTEMGRVNDPETFTAVSKKIGELWSSMPSEDRKQWIEKSKREHEEYDIKRKEYEEKRILEAKQQVQALAGRLAASGKGFGPLKEKSSPLTGIDMDVVHKGIQSVASDAAYYLVVDSLRHSDPRRKDVITAASHYVLGRKKPDWKSFLVSCFGFEKARQFFKDDIEL